LENPILECFCEILYNLAYFAIKEMNKILIAILIAYSYSRTEEYYTNCLEGAPGYKNNKLSVSQCKEYSPTGGHCCLITYKIKEDEVNIPLNMGNTFGGGDNYNNYNNAYKKGKRFLEEKEYVCYGITSKGYANIEEVKKEIKKETGVSGMDIDCSSDKLNILILLSYSLLFLLL